MGEDPCRFTVSTVKEEKPLYSEWQGFTQKLTTAHRCIVDVAPLESDEPFPRLQREFLMRHGGTICGSLQSCYHQGFHLSPARLSREVRSRFLDVCRGRSAMTGALRPAFHGTAAENLNSILQHGLLIPGQSVNGATVRVCHGSAFGLGIYTGLANQEGASLSHGFSNGGPMMVCGVLDDAAPVSPSCINGLLQVTAESANVRHVGVSMVVFDSRRVTPLFIASPAQLKAKPAALASNETDWRIERILFKHRQHLRRLAEQYPEKKTRVKQRLICQHPRWIGPAAFLNRRTARKRRPR